MDDIHVSRELFRAVARGELPQSFLDGVTLEHLLSLCPHCRAEVHAYEGEVQAGPSLWSRVLQAFSVLLDRFLALGSREIRRAEEDLQVILSLPAAERAVRIERARTRFRSPALVRLLLEESRRSIPGQPGEAHDLADLARRVANRNPRMQEYFDLYTLATALMANARRANGDLQGAGQVFEVVRRTMSQHGVTDLEVVARVDDLMGSLRKDQRRLADAEQLLKRAAQLFGLKRKPDDAARVLTNLEARRGCIGQGIGYDAAMVSLDLAILYLKEGRMADVQRVAEEMLPIFQAQDVHREALAALQLFQEAARQQELTIERALEVAAYLWKARTEPGLRFEWR